MKNNKFLCALCEEIEVQSEEDICGDCHDLLQGNILDGLIPLKETAKKLNELRSEIE